MVAILLSASFPVVIFLILIYRRDTIKEPPGLLIKCFVLGCISTIPIVVVELIVSEFNTFESLFMRSFYEAFIVAAICEEGFKFLFLYLIIWKRKEFNQYYDGIVYAVFVSLGFALIENILYVAEFGFGTAILRAILSVPGHGLFGVCMGYFFALARFIPERRTKLMWFSFLIPVLFHGLFNFFLMSMAELEETGIAVLLFLGFVASLIILWRRGLKYIKRHSEKDRANLFPANYPSKKPAINFHGALRDVLDAELRAGNIIIEVWKGDWPYRDINVISLWYPFLTPIRRDLINIYFRNINDPRYWKAEYYDSESNQLLTCKFGGVGDYREL